VFVVVVVVAFFGLIVSRISLDRSAFVLDDLDEQIAVAEAEYWDLRLEVARLQDPERIAAAARDMGLVFPEERHALDVPPTEASDLDPEARWAQLKALLSAQP
jgi:cell division protein FtsL